MMNPTPWPSFENLSVWYSEWAMDRIDSLEAVVTLIQRWYRRKQLYPIFLNSQNNNNKARRRPALMPLLISSLQKHKIKKNKNKNKQQQEDDDDDDDNNDVLKKPVFASEKMDGTNFGICSDGTMYGRRNRIEPGTLKYQRVPLMGIVPSMEDVIGVKQKLEQIFQEEQQEEEEGKKTEFPFQLILYGELMCNPGRYNYSHRGFRNTFLCFGAILSKKRQKLASNFTKHKKGAPKQSPATESERIINQTALQKGSDLARCLNERAGLCTTVDIYTGNVRITNNVQWKNLLQSHGISCAPPLLPLCHENRPLKELCEMHADIMMQNDALEGIVISGPNFLKKWKTGEEDESKGILLLKSLLRDYPTFLLEMVGVDLTFLTLLERVASNKRPKKPQTKTKGTTTKTEPCASSFQDDVLEKAIVSACSKYDALETYFEKNDIKIIKNLIFEEVVNDLGPSSAMELKYINKAVSKNIGMAYATWKRER